MGDDYRSVLGAAQLVDAACHDAQGVDIKSRVGLVEYGQGGVEHCHLEYLVLLLLTAAEAFVHRTVGKVSCHLDHLLFLLHQLQEFGAAQRVEASVFALLVDGGAHKIGDCHAGNLHRVLETEEYAFVGTHVDGQVKDILAVVYYFAFGDSVFGVAGDDASKGALAVTVGTHNGVHLAFVYFQINAFQYLAVAYRGVQIAYGQE